MAIDPYAPCPCGSRKKFKWCCQPIHVQLDRALHLEAEGQHEAALRLVDAVVAENPANPEPLGRKAQVLYQNHREEEAEKALQQAFAINPEYPFGHLLQGLFRQEEGEIPGALLMFRKAADLYDPEARDYLAQIYSLIANCELKLNRPVAAHAALKLAARCDPANENLRKALGELFDAGQGRLPASARRDYTFQSPPAGADSPRRDAWNRALASAAAKLPDAASAFEQLTNEDGDDAAAWYNLGLARAWLGQNHAALEALDRYVALEADEARAGAAWALGEVLRAGHGMLEEADYVEHAALFQIRDPRRFSFLLEELQREHRFAPLQVNQEQGIITGVILERPAALTPELAATQMVGLGAYLLIVVDHLRLWHTNSWALTQAREEISRRAGPALAEVRTEQNPANFNDLLAEAVAFAVQPISEEQGKQRVRAFMERFFEETWLQRPLKSLNRIPPIDAAGNPTLKKKLGGCVQFLQDCAGPTQNYDFDRLRRKLGLLSGIAGEGSAAPATAAPAPAPALDITSLGAAELAALPADALAGEQLEQAFQTALQLDARELAGKFARLLAALPARPDRPRDRFPWYLHLVQLAQSAGDFDAALDAVNAGEKADCEENEGRRRHDYELRRAQLHAKRGDADSAHDLFDQLIQRVPSELRYRGSAAEAMLSAKQSAHALHFAEQGLAKAREQNDRDSEQYFMELVEAAKRTG